MFSPEISYSENQLKLSDHFPKKKNLAEYFYPNLKTFSKNQLKTSEYFRKKNPENPKTFKINTSDIEFQKIKLGHKKT